MLGCERALRGPGLALRPLVSTSARHGAAHYAGYLVLCHKFAALLLPARAIRLVPTGTEHTAPGSRELVSILVPKEVANSLQPLPQRQAVDA